MKQWLVGLACVGMWTVTAMGQAMLPVNESYAAAQDWTALTGWSGTSVDAYADGRARFNATADSLTVNFIGTPDALTFDLKGNETTSGTAPMQFLAEESADGASWTQIVSIDETQINASAFTTFGPYTLNSASRYVRWTYVNKYAFNIGLNNVTITSSGPPEFVVTLDKANGFIVGEGTSAAITATATNGTAPYAFGWTSDLDEAHYAAVDNVFTILDTAPTGSYSAVVTATDDAALAATNSVTFMVRVGSSLIISEVADPSGTGGQEGRFVELYNAGASPVDLAAGTWVLSRQANGGSWSNVPLTGTVGVAGKYVVAYSATSFPVAYPLAPAPDQVDTAITGSGNDGYFLYSGGDHTVGTLQDAYGVINEDGNGKAWEYTDSRAVRNTGVIAGTPMWTAAEWTIAAAAYADMTPGVHPDGAAVFGVGFSLAEGFTVEEGAAQDLVATAVNGAEPYTYGWTSTLNGLYFTADTNRFTILATAPVGVYSATVTATDNAALSVTNTINFSVVVPAPKHAITITPPVDGTVTTTPADEASEGATVVITATPVDGTHRVASIAVVDAALNPVTVNGNSFTMPGSAVTVTVLFELAPASRILISQYTETDTGSIPKGIEIWNVSGADITFDGTANLLDVKVGSGGAAPVSVVTANSGTLAAGEVWVVGTADMTPDLAETFLFNGDDAVVLELGGAVQDIVGTVGVDPGVSWTNAGVSTANQNIQLKDGLAAGDLDGWSDPSERFEYVAAGSVLTGFGIAPGGAAAFGVTVDRTNGFVVAEGSSAAITATAANGTPEYGYSWSTTVAEGQYTAVGNVFTILATAPAGGYSATVTATDSSDPVQTAEKTVTFSVAAPYAIAITPPVDGTVTTTPADEAIAGATVTITATPVDGNHRVANIAVVDAALNPVAVTGNTFVMPASAVTVTVLFEAYDAPDALIDFEDYAGSYAWNEYAAGGVTWTMTNAFAGATADDSKNGLKSGRFENNRGGAGNPAKMTSTAFAEPVTKINFFYANYGVNDGGGFKVQVSANGADWTDVGAAEYNPASKTLVEGVIDTLPADMTYVQFITTAGTAQRVNIDDIGIYFGAATPTLSYAGATTIQLGESFALEFTLNGATASGWQYLLEGSGREDLDNGSVNTFNFTPTFAGTYYLTMTALDEAVNPIATREVVLTVESGLPPADIGEITFLPASGDFTFELPAGYTTPVAVYGADAEVGPLGNWDFSILTEGVHYTRDGATVTILTAPQSSQIIRIGVSSNPD